MIVDSENQLVWIIIIQLHIKSDTNHRSDIHQPRSGVCAEERKASSDLCVTSVEFAFILIGLLYYSCVFGPLYVFKPIYSH